MKRLFLILSLVIGLFLGCVTTQAPVVQPVAKCSGPKAMPEKEFRFEDQGVEYRVMFVDADCDGSCDVVGLFQVVGRAPDNTDDLVVLLEKGTCEVGDAFVAEIREAQKKKGI